ncbi:MAG: discoidin domain-containing protein [Pirellulaceae bacterium]
MAWSGLFVFVMASLGASLSATAQDDSGDAPRPLRALLITGGCCHDYEAQKNLIKRGLEARANIEVTVVHQGGSSTNSRIPLYENADWADGYDIVLHDECFADVDDPQWTARVLEPHRNGVPGVVIHCAMHCYRDGTDQWFEFCGVTSRRHGAHYPHEVLTRDGEHPVMQGWGAGWANPAGELYWIEKVWETAHPLASSRNQEKGNEEVCVWTNDYRGTRVFGTTLGHHNETVDSPEFLDLLTRGTLWACDKLNDDYLKPAKPIQRPVNLARGARATASSEETGKGNLAPLAVDGNSATRWCADGPSAPQWLEIDLGAAKEVRGCLIEWESSGRPYRHQVLVSNDGEQWTTVAEAVDEEQAQAAADRTANGATHEFERDNVRYLKIEFLGAPTGSWGSIREVSVFGTEVETIDPQDAGALLDEEVMSDVRVPEGFRATVFAQPPAVNYPVFVATEPDGTTYVSVDRNGSLDRNLHRGSVYRLRDIDGDGRADESILFTADVDSPRGMVWMRDRLIVLHPPHLTAFIDADHDGVAESSQRLVSDIAFGFADRPADHTSNGVTLGIDGWLYLAIGDFGFMQATGSDGTQLQMRGGGVVRVRPDGSGMHVYSRGTRNILEVGLTPRLDGFARDNTNDGGGWDIRLHHFSGLEDHGYPTRFIHFPAEIVQPLADYGGGSGCGACYVSEPGLPAGFGDALYTVDWGRNAVFRHQLSANGATFAADQSEFLGLTRPTDIDVDAAGRLMVSSWKGATFTYAGEKVGYLIRLQANDTTAEPWVDPATLNDFELANLLQSASHRTRLAAQAELLQRGWAKETNDHLLLIASNETASLDSRIAALFTIALGMGDRAVEPLSILSADPVLGPWAIRALGELEICAERPPHRVLERGLASSSARAVLETIRAIANCRVTRMAPALIAKLGDADPIIRHTAGNALIELGAWGACLEAWDQSLPIAGTALNLASRMPEGGLVEQLVERMGSEADGARREQLFIALARLRFVEGEWNGASWGTRPDTRGPVYQPTAWEASDLIVEQLIAALETAPASELPQYVRELQRHRSQGQPFTGVLARRAEREPAAMESLLTWIENEPRLDRDVTTMLVSLLERDDVDLGLAARGLEYAWRGGQLSAEQAIDGWLSLQQRDSAIATATLRAMRAPDAVRKHQDELIEQLAEPSRTTSAIALLTALDVPLGGDESLLPLRRALQSAWESDGGPERWLTALEWADERRFEDRLWQAQGSEDPELRAHAVRLADAWGIEPLAPGSGPTIREVGREAALNELVPQGEQAERGARWFARLNCANCHTVREGEPARGPHLPNVVKTYNRQQLAEALLFPSKTLAQGFVTESFETDDGATLVGFVVSEQAERIVIRDAQGREHELPVEQIVFREQQTTSVMPEGLVDDLTPADLGALLDYLRTLNP